MTRVLVTGATGFVGRALCGRLAEAGYLVRAAVRNESNVPASVTETIVVGDMLRPTRWEAAVEGVDCIVHAAARAHVMHDSAAADLYIRTNTEVTRALAQCAVRAQVKRFVYVSSIKVNGDENPGEPYTAASPPRPSDPYGKSKLLAERNLADAAAGSCMHAVIVRPPLVYGPGVRANFLRLLQWIDRGRILPFGAINNLRSLVNVWNLTDLLTHVIESAGAINRTWLVSDGEDLSTPELIRRIARAMGRRPRLLAVPTALLRVAGAVTGRSAEIARLCGSLTVDIGATRADLAWRPPVALDEGIARTVAWYERTRGGGTQT
jgi:nucleoside-diphosphate-sugar epimerase